MKVACYVHPIVHPLGPLFNYGHFEICTELLHTLCRDAGAECLLIARSQFFRRAIKEGKAQSLRGLRVAKLDEIFLYQKVSAAGILPTSLDSLAYATDSKNHDALRLLAEEIERSSMGFIPDVVISFAIQIDFLESVWPNALRLHCEMGPYSRNPYPRSLFFDHLGMYGRSVIGQAGGRIRAREVSTDACALARAFRSNSAAALSSVNPFQIYDFHNRFDRICLLPLQVSDYYSFDEQTNYRTQFEFVFDVLALAPRDVGLLVTEYVEWGPVIKTRGPGENLDYLRQAFPNFIFDTDFRAYCAPSQFLVPHVDGVWSVSSNVGYQALLFNKLLGSPKTSHLASVADITELTEFFGELKENRSKDNDAFIAWQLEHYLVPEALLADGRWLNDYLERRILAARTANDPVDAFVPIADINRLEQAWVGSAPSPRALTPEPSVEARLQTRLQAILQSRSWRATAPLRAATTAFRLWRAWFAEWVNLPIRDQLRALIALIGNFSAISKIRSNELFAGRAARPEAQYHQGS